jgi:hypothetical protein
MEAILIGPQGVARDRAERVVTAAGHRVHRCHERAWGCVGLDDACALDVDEIDVAIAVAGSDGRFDPQGIACAHRARIPIVTVGADPADPACRYALVNVGDLDGAFVEAIESTAREASGHRAAVVQALCAHLGPDETVAVTAERMPRCLEITLATDLDRGRHPALADVARAAVRRYDRRIEVIDVSIIPVRRELVATAGEAVVGPHRAPSGRTRTPS